VLESKATIHSHHILWCGAVVHASRPVIGIGARGFLEKEHRGAYSQKKAAKIEIEAIL
jgi:hypothetical protein